MTEDIYRPIKRPQTLYPHFHPEYSLLEINEICGICLESGGKNAYYLFNRAKELKVNALKLARCVRDKQVKI